MVFCRVPAVRVCQQDSKHLHLFAQSGLAVNSVSQSSTPPGWWCFVLKSFVSPVFVPVPGTKKALDTYLLTDPLTHRQPDFTSRVRARPGPSWIPGIFSPNFKKQYTLIIETCKIEKPSRTLKRENRALPYLPSHKADDAIKSSIFPFIKDPLKHVFNGDKMIHCVDVPYIIISLLWVI